MSVLVERRFSKSPSERLKAASRHQKHKASQSPFYSTQSTNLSAAQHVATSAIAGEPLGHYQALRAACFR